MTDCAVDRCDEPVNKKGFTLCSLHWKAHKEGELTRCTSCNRLKDDSRPLCFSCFKAQKGTAVSVPRRPGQGARELADAIAKKNPFGMLLSKLTFGFIKAPGYSWRVGAEAEEAVARELAKLPPGWFVRHDLMLDRSWNVDHIVVGPSGAFVLDTKFRSGDVETSKIGIRVNGRKTKMAEKVRDQARQVSIQLREGGRMRTWVQAVLVFENDFHGAREPNDVHVVGRSTLVDYLTELARELDDHEVKQIGNVLMDDATWPNANRPSDYRRLVKAASTRERRATAIVLAALVGLLVAGGSTAFFAASRSPASSKVAVSTTRGTTASGVGEQSPTVLAIRERYQDVGATQRTLTKVEKQIGGLSTEGSSHIGYLDRGTLKKAEWTFLGEGGQQLNELMFHDGRLEFVFQKVHGGGTGGVPWPDGERRFYLEGGKVIWATQGKNRSPMSSADIAAAQPRLLEMGAQVEAALKAEGSQLTFEAGKFVPASN